MRSRYLAACALCESALPLRWREGRAIGAPSVVCPAGLVAPSGVSNPWADAWVVSSAVFAIDCEKIRVLKAGNGFPVKGEMLELFNMVSIEAVDAAAGPQGLVEAATAQTMKAR